MIYKEYGSLSSRTLKLYLTSVLYSQKFAMFDKKATSKIMNIVNI